MAEQPESGSIWEDGLGRHDIDARVLSRGEVALTPDPQSVRYGDGDARITAEAVVAGPAFRGRPVVDVRVSEGLRPLYLRMTPEQARRAAEVLAAAAERANEEGAGGPDAPRS